MRRKRDSLINRILGGLACMEDLTATYHIGISKSEEQKGFFKNGKRISREQFFAESPDVSTTRVNRIPATD